MTTSVVPLPSLSALAFAALSPPDGAGASAPEAEWIAAGCAADHGLLEDLPAAFAAWLRNPPASDRRLAALAAAIGLTRTETLAVALGCAAETDPMAARALAWLQAPVGGARPVAGLVASLAQRFGESSPVAALAAGAARACGLLQSDPETSRPLPEWPITVPQPVVLALAQPPTFAWPGLSLGMTDPPPLPPSMRDAAARRAQALADRAASVVVIRSGHPREARAAAAAVCASLGAQPLFLEGDPPPGLGPWLWLAHAIPVICAELAPGERTRLKEIRGWNGPLLVAAGPDGSFELDGEVVPAWRIPVPDAAERSQLWHAATNDAALAARLGPPHRHASARIAELVRAARYQAALDGRSDIGVEEIAAAARSGAGDLGTLAELLPEPVADEALVLAPATRSELELLRARCLGREALAADLGPASRARYRPGVRALFVGPSGTGKTLAAGWLATRLGLPLYRVDLAGVTSKYIGETEKNLAQLFARAEHAEVVLLFDEADSLFGKRTDVKDSNDRFANAQTNYLLSRIESYEGIAILTSNSRARFDAAFTRRLDVIIEIPAPGPEERRELWAAHLGDAHPLPSADLNRLAASCELTGGHVRNAVLAAASAARQHGRRIGIDDLLAAAAAEYRKLGKTPPAALAASPTRARPGP